MSSGFEGLNFTPFGAQQASPTQAQVDAVEGAEEEVDAFEGLNFTPYEPPKREGLGGKLTRGAARTGPRAVEALGGFAGGLQSFIKGAVTKGVGLVVGQERAEKAADLAQNVTQLIPGMNLPGSQDIREGVTKKLTGEYLEPQTEYEELYDTIIEDLALLALPVKGKIPFARALGTSVISNLSAQTAKELGAGEKTQTATKLGTMLLSGMLGREGAKTHVSKLHDEARALIPEGEVIGAEKLITKLDGLQAELRKGGITPSKTPTMALSRQLINKIQQVEGELPVEELPAFRQSVNELRFGRDLPPKTRFYLNRFDDILNKELMEYGKENPAFLKTYRDANIGTAGLKQSNKMSRFIKSKFDTSKLSPETAALVFIHTPPGLLAKGAGALASVSGAKVLSRFARNPVLRKYYANVVSSSLKGNAATMIKNLEGLDREMKKVNNQ